MFQDQLSCTPALSHVSSLLLPVRQEVGINGLVISTRNLRPGEVRGQPEQVGGAWLSLQLLPPKELRGRVPA